MCQQSERLNAQDSGNTKNLDHIKELFVRAQLVEIQTEEAAASPDAADE